MAFTRPKCDNCGKYFYMRQKRAFDRTFCSKVCQREFHKLSQRMSSSQLFVLNKLIKNGDEAKLKDSRTLHILIKRNAPLVEIVRRIDETTLHCRITDKGRFWYEQKIGVKTSS